MRSEPVLGLVTTMLGKAMAKLDLKTRPMIDSDQGWHNRHIAYRNTLKTKGLEQSMSRKGNCLDNAVAENFFGHFRSELDTYIRWFNNDHIGIKLKELSPVDFRVQSLANMPPTPN